MNLPGSTETVELRLVNVVEGFGPVTCGIPWPRGVLQDVARLALRDSRDRPIPLQARPLDRWSDGSVRWVLLDWHAEAEMQPYRLTLGEGSHRPQTGMTVEASGGTVTVETGAARFELGAGDVFPFRSVLVSGVPAIDAALTRFVVEDENGFLFLPKITAIQIEEPGPVRALVRLQGELISPGSEALANFSFRLHFFAGSAMVRFEVTLCNPRKADHPGGLWDLGNGGSIYLRDAALTLALPAGAGVATICCSSERGAAFEQFQSPFELYQDSSGGEQWRSSNHLNRRHVVPNTFRGYLLKAGEVESSGVRATPAVFLAAGNKTLGATVPCFWQNFPQALEAAGDTLVLRLFPRQYADVHELQGGEQKTHRFTLQFGEQRGVSTEQSLAWVREAVSAAASPDWYCASGALPYLTPKANDPNTGYLTLVDAAIEGADTFDHKREVVDEYGWRHFGDIYGDHEAVFHKGPTPLVSHYNN